MIKTLTTKRTFILLLIIFTFSSQIHAQEREITNLNTDWKFFKGNNQLASQNSPSW